MIRMLREDARRRVLIARFRGIPAMRGPRLRVPCRGPAKLGQRGLADEGPPFHAAVGLRGGERVLASDLAQRRAAVEAGRLRGSNLVRVEADPRTDPARALTAVAEGDGDDAVSHARDDPDRQLD